MLSSERGMLQAASQSSVDLQGFPVAGMAWYPVSAAPLIPPTWARGARASSSKHASSQHIGFRRPGYFAVDILAARVRLLPGDSLVAGLVGSRALAQQELFSAC